MNKYEVLQTIGEGAYGVVLQCRNKETNDLVAIKRFKESDEDELVHKTTLREVKILRLLKEETYVVHLIEAFRRKGKLYLVFEYVGCNLLDVLEENPQGLEMDTVKRMTFTALLGIRACHANSVIHRDVKPENLLVHTDNNTLRLCDFGFARIYNNAMDDLTDYVATRWYRSPELLLGTTDYGLPSDIWALGCIMSEMIDGQALFPGESELDQLFLIQKLLGNFTPKQVEIFDANKRFAGKSLRDINKTDTTLERKFTRKAGKKAVSLLKMMLVIDPDKRITIDDAIHHPFFDGMIDTYCPQMKLVTPMIRPSTASRQQQQQPQIPVTQQQQQQQQQQVPPTANNNQSMLHPQQHHHHHHQQQQQQQYMPTMVSEQHRSEQAERTGGGGGGGMSSRVSHVSSNNNSSYMPTTTTTVHHHHHQQPQQQHPQQHFHMQQQQQQQPPSATRNIWGARLGSAPRNPQSQPHQQVHQQAGTPLQSNLYTTGSPVMETPPSFSHHPSSFPTHHQQQQAYQPPQHQQRQQTPPSSSHHYPTQQQQQQHQPQQTNGYQSQQQQQQQYQTQQVQHPQQHQGFRAPSQRTSGGNLPRLNFVPTSSSNSLGGNNNNMFFNGGGNGVGGGVAPTTANLAYGTSAQRGGGATGGSTGSASGMVGHSSVNGGHNHPSRGGGGGVGSDSGSVQQGPYKASRSSQPRYHY